MEKVAQNLLKIALKSLCKVAYTSCGRGVHIGEDFIYIKIYKVSK